MGKTAAAASTFLDLKPAQRVAGGVVGAQADDDLGKSIPIQGTWSQSMRSQLFSASSLECSPRRARLDQRAASDWPSGFIPASILHTGDGTKREAVRWDHGRLARTHCEPTP